MAITEAEGTGYRYNVTFYDEADDFDATDSTYYLASSAGCLAPGTLVTATAGGTVSAATTSDNVIGVVTGTAGTTWIRQGGVYQLGSADSSSCTSTAYSYPSWQRYWQEYGRYRTITATELRIRQQEANQRAHEMARRAFMRYERELTYSVGLGAEAQPADNMTHAQPRPEMTHQTIQAMQQALEARTREIQQQMNEACERMTGNIGVIMGQPRQEGAIDHERQRRMEERLRDAEIHVRACIDEMRRGLEMEQGAPLSLMQQTALRQRAENDLEYEQRRIRREFERPVHRNPSRAIQFFDEAEMWRVQEGSGLWEEAEGTRADPMGEIRRKREEAEARAQELLGSLIGKSELEVYKETGHLFIRGRKYNYIVPRGDGFIKKIGDGKVEDMCVHLARRDSMPKTDNVVAMKLFLENNEKEALKMANIHRSVREEEHGSLPRCAGMSA